MLHAANQEPGFPNSRMFLFLVMRAAALFFGKDAPISEMLLSGYDIMQILRNEMKEEIHNLTRTEF